MYSDPLPFYVYDTDAPNPPSGLDVTPTGDGWAHLSWSQSEKDVNEDGQYKIFRASTSGSVPTTWSQVATINSNYTVSWTDPDVAVGTGNYSLFYRLVAVDCNGNESSPSSYDWVPWSRIFRKEAVENEIITEYKLNNNFPNPFNPSTIINYSTPQNGYVSLKVYDMLGNEVANLVSTEKEKGNYFVVFDASNLSSGIYIYTLKTNEFIASKRMVLMK